MSETIQEKEDTSGSKNRPHLKPQTMEALRIVKSDLKAESIDEAVKRLILFEARRHGKKNWIEALEKS